MATVSFKKGNLADLAATAIVEGQILITTDERSMYVDVGEGQRIRLGDFIEVANVAALAAEKEKANLSQTALYYCTEENILAKYNGTDFVQINYNTDTGATVAANEGEGFTDGDSPKLTYSAENRTMTLTIPKKLVTEEALTAKLGEIGEGTVAEFVTGEIAKISGSETELEGRVETLEAQIKTKAEAETVTTLSGKVDTLTSTVGSEESGLVKQVSDLENKVGDSPVSDQIEEAITALNLDTTYAKASELETANQKITAVETKNTEQDNTIKSIQEQLGGLSGAMHYKGAAEEDPATMVSPKETYAAGDVVTWNAKEYVFDGTQNKFIEFGDVSAEGERLTVLEAWKTNTSEQLTTIETSVSQETTRAKAAEEANATAISTEQTRATAAEEKAKTDAVTEAKLYTDQEIGKINSGLEWGDFTSAAGG